MRTQSLVRLAALAVAGATLWIGSRPPAAVAAVPLRRPTSPEAVAPKAPRRPAVVFEENRGQTDARARFLARTRGLTAFLGPAEAVFALHASVPKDAPADDPLSEKVELRTEAVRMRFVGARDDAEVEARDAMPGRCNYLIGNDRDGWVTDVPTSARAVQRGVWPGVDVVWRGDDQGRLTYDIVLAPGADAASVQFEFEGGRAVSVGDDGSLRIPAELGELRQSRPVAYQLVDGVRHAVDAAFRVGDDGRVGFLVGPHDARVLLVIDPSLTYATYLGGSDPASIGPLEIARGVAVDASGAVYVAGRTSSADFPTQSAFQSSRPHQLCSFVSKFNSSGSALVYSTYLGGTSPSNASTQVSGIAVDSSGAACVTGVTTTTDYPTQNAIQSTKSGGGDVIVTKLDPSGSSLGWSTYLGGSGADSGSGIAVDGAGAVYVTGSSQSSNFPLQSALQSGYGGGGQAFVVKIDASGTSLAFSTYLGGSGGSSGSDIAIDSSGNAHVVGYAGSNFPTQSPLQGAYAGNVDGFVAKLNSSGSALLWSTYLGGSARDEVSGLALDASGAVYVTGRTDSSDFPTASAFQGTLAGGKDAFVAKIDSSGSALAYSTFLGGSGDEIARAIAVDSRGAATVAGPTYSSDFPTASPSQPSFGGGLTDSFVATLSPDGSTLESSTYLGGSDIDEAMAMDMDSTGAVYVVGDTFSFDFPTASPFQPTFGGGTSDAFIVRYGGGGGQSSGSPPAAPTNFTAVYTEGEGVSLSWSDQTSDETGFRIERRPTGYSFSVLAIMPSNTTSATDTLLVSNTTYTYRVRALRADGPSAWSNEASITTPPTLPVPPLPRGPSNLVAADLGDGTIGLSWKDNSADEVHFGIERAIGAGSFRALGTVPSDVTRSVDAAVRPGWPYAYRVRALALQGPSPYSNVATVTIPATLDVTTLSGALTDSPKLHNDKFNVTVSWALPSEGASPLDPVVDGLELRIGDLAVSIPPGDAIWKTKKVKKGKRVAVKATWTSGAGTTPKATVTVDLTRHLITVSVSGADFETAPTSAMRILVACGAEGGSHAAEWTERKTGVFQFGAKQPKRRR